ncbi:hypothetical protein [Kingella oralis]|nr:hypothetical protein [Kingella oralis]QMT43450.1 hypothetical protein H3L93_03685 [Kingella oralis]
MQNRVASNQAVFCFSGCLYSAVAARRHFGNEQTQPDAANHLAAFRRCFILVFRLP